MEFPKNNIITSFAKAEGYVDTSEGGGWTGPFPEGTIREWKYGTAVKKNGKWQIIKVPDEIARLAKKVGNLQTTIEYSNQDLIAAKMVFEHLTDKHFTYTEKDFVSYLDKVGTRHYRFEDGVKYLWINKWLQDAPLITPEDLKVFVTDLELFADLMRKGKGGLEGEDEQVFDTIWGKLLALDGEYKKFPIVLDIFKEAHELKNNRFKDNFIIKKALELKIKEKYQRYREKFREKIIIDEGDRQENALGITPKDKFKEIYKKVFGGFYKGERVQEYLIKRFRAHGIKLSSDWGTEAAVAALRNFENFITNVLPMGHVLTNEDLVEIENFNYNGQKADREGYAFYNPKYKKISISSLAMDSASAYGNLTEPDEFNSVITHEIGHAMSKKLRKKDNWEWKMFTMLCGWDNRQPEIKERKTITAGQPDLKRLGRNQDRPLLTEYANKSPEEALAEYYSFYTLNRKQIDKWLDTGDDKHLNYKGILGTIINNKNATAYPGLIYRDSQVDKSVILKNEVVLRHLRDNIWLHPEIVKAIEETEL